MNGTDQEWLARARTELVLARVAAPVRDELLGRAQALSAQAGEAPDALFGSPEKWVEEQLAERRSQGLPSALPEPAASWRDVPVLGMYAAAGFAAVLLLHSVARQEWRVDYTVALIGAPLLGGLLTIAALTAWEKTLARHSVRTAVATGVAVLVGEAALVGLFLHQSRDVEIGTGGVWYLVLLALVCGLVGRLLDGALPEERRPSWVAPRDDDEWVGVLAGVLRLRADMPESRVRTIVDEARAHVEETGTTLQREFGRPEDYASQFPVDDTPAVRRWWRRLTSGAGPR